MKRRQKKENEGEQDKVVEEEFSQVPHERNSMNEKDLVFHSDIMKQVMRVLLIALAFATRMKYLDVPKHVVFDEVHFGRFTTYFLNRTFFFDVNPPFPKLVFAYAGFLTGLNSSFMFSGIGQDLGEIIFHVWCLRLIPATFSTLVIPCIYEILLELGCSVWLASLGSVLAIFDNMLVIQGRFILLDSFLHFFTLFAIMAYLKFRKKRSRPFSLLWWFWLVCIGLGLAGAVSTRYSGIFVVALVGLMMGYEMWNMIEDLNISPSFWTIHFLCRGFGVFLLPLLLYFVQFYVLLSLLTNSGPQDDMMSSAFQASLKGGLSTITKGQAPVVAYGSQITLRHTHGKQCWLHSHAHVYPVKYEDNRGSSAQQQVTCYPFKDINNWWIVKDPKVDKLTTDYPPVPVKNGDVIQLVHGTTGRALNSHDVASPLTPQHQEVSCYIDYNISMAAQNLWRLEIVNGYEKSEWQTLQSQVRLVHVNTSQAVKISGKQLPDWGFHQFEVCTDRIIQSDETVWNVEEHQQNITYPEGVKPEETTSNEDVVVEMPFYEKFKELQFKMMTATKELQQDHLFSSRPEHWPLMKRGVAYWLDNDSNKQIFCIGNPMVWWPAFLTIHFYFALLGLYLLRRQRAFYDIDEECWQKFVFCGCLLLGGYFLHYLPFFPAEQTLFIHQYLPALLFNILLLPSLAQHVLDNLSFIPYLRTASYVIITIYGFLVLSAFHYFSPFTYGDTHLTGDEILQRKWLDSWDFLIHR
ncbi:protein O-mannosyl-transferase 1-like [Xenia sp. Carnegie-2017]|uniref:protein O-mannosyl-transferase 1-like n=1 Tax=Xenia sp. Carnegie-2017 TaxID=2897299 RepID=UPI001F03CFFA|nr:protein O-mannosyl-transferase 1-like [Xenia sp. Carnegie-2017]